jgi:hypothetical protein
MSPPEVMVHAAIDAINEPRTARLHPPTKPSVKASIETAADLMGIEASAFDKQTTPAPSLVEAWQLHCDQVQRS